MMAVARLNKPTDSAGASADRELLRSLLAAEAGNIPASSGQRGLWFVDRLGVNDSAYNVFQGVRLQGRLDIPALQRATMELVCRHEALRTTFAAVDGEPVQVVGDPDPGVFIQTDLGNLPAEQRDAALEAVIREELAYPFDLSAGPLVRVRLVVLHDSEYVLLFNLHHIIIDGWSLELLFSELGTAYAAFLSGSESALPDSARQYAAFARWEQDWLRSPQVVEKVEFWQGQLDGMATLQMPTDNPRPAIQSFAGAQLTGELPGELVQGLRLLGQRRGATLYMALLCAYLVLLRKYTGQDDIVVGSPVANRGRREFENVVGFFVNNVVLRVRCIDGETFGDLLARVRDVSLGAFAHQDVPFETLVSELGSERDLGRNPLFQVAFALQREARDALKLEGLQVSPLAVDIQRTHMDIECHVIESGRGFAVRLVYSTDLFDRSTMQQLLRHYIRILEAVVANPDVRVADIELLSEAERSEQLDVWAGSSTPYPRDATIPQLFAEQVARAPQAPALSFGERVVSYAELDRWSGVVASRLRSAGVAAGTSVGVLLERSVEMVVSWLGVLKAGGAYVPLDVDYPTGRLEFMLRDAGVSLVLSDGELPARLPLEGLSFVDVCSLDAAAAVAPVDSGSGPLDAAYIVYTSGSTGEPKGVVVPQRGVVRLVKGADYVQLGPEDRVAQGSNASFDAATFEVWGSLLNGGCLVGVPREVLLDAERYGEHLQSGGVTALFMTTALFNQFAAVRPAAFAGMRSVLFGGEAVDVGAVRRVLAAGGPDRLLHVYGPTESTTFSSWHAVSAVPAEAVTIPIGGPVANTRLYVLGERRELLPAGVEGELYIGGDGLALGYLNRPELTAEKFVSSPFEAGDRLYRTGDLVRWRDGGVLEFVGRIDAQVKVRGYRIELGEIEHALSRQAGVREAVVLCREDSPGDKRLVAYVVAESAVSPEALRTGLKDRLPDYMVPSAFVVLESLPLTPNGKVDRSALPAPEGERQLDGVYVAPGSELERRIAAIWCEVLGVDRVGIDDNFFELGGNSLLVMRLRRLLEKALGRELAVVDFFDYPTVRTLGRHCATDREDSAGGTTSSSLAKVHERAQKRRKVMHQRGRKVTEDSTR